MSTPSTLPHAQLVHEGVGGERRVRVRYAPPHDSLCQLVEAETSDTWSPATVQNLSEIGIALSSLRSYRPQALLVIEFQQSPADRRPAKVGRVVHVTPLAEGTWLIGCAFVSKLTSDELRVLLS
jgi:hypothetical protein